MLDETESEIEFAFCLVPSMSILLDPKMQLLDSFEGIDDDAYEDETIEYITLHLGACAVPDSIQILVNPLLHLLNPSR